jgi:hypothetical protein
MTGGAARTGPGQDLSATDIFTIQEKTKLAIESDASEEQTSLRWFMQILTSD